MYGIGGAQYGGEAQMLYDPACKLFAYRLPAVTRELVGDDARSVGLAVVIDASPADLDLADPPVTGAILFAGYCLGTLSAMPSSISNRRVAGSPPGDAVRSLPRRGDPPCWVRLSCGNEWSGHVAAGLRCQCGTS